MNKTLWYGGSAIFSFALTDEDSVMKLNRPYMPPSRYLLEADGDNGEWSEVEYD